MSRKSDKDCCPHCKSGEGFIPIIYGLPTDELFRKAETGEVALGGCVFGRDSPLRICKMREKTPDGQPLWELASAQLAELLECLPAENGGPV